MKKIILACAALLVLTAAVFTACKKTKEVLDKDAELKEVRNHSRNTSDIQSDAQQFFEKWGPQRQVFKMNSEELPKTIELKSGTLITIPAKGLMVGGQPAAGDIVVSVLETFDRGALALSGQSTTSNGQLLTSDGSFDLDITVNGKEADPRLANGETFGFRVPDVDNNGRPTNLFEGVILDNPDAPAPLDWQRRDVPNQRPDIIPEGGTFNFNWPYTGLVNCDVLNSCAPAAIRTDITVNLPNNPGTIANYQGSGGGNTFVLFVPKGCNMIVHIYTHDPADQHKVWSYPSSMPEGVTGKLIGFSVKNGNWWYTEKEITITTNMIESLTLDPSTEVDVAANLLALSSY